MTPEQIRAHVSEAEDTGDIPAILRFAAEDLIHAFPGERPTVGMDAVGAFLQIVYERFDLSTAYSSDGSSESGDLLVDRGSVVMTFAPADGGDPQTETFPYEWTFRRGASGSWEITSLTYGSTAPPESLVPNLPEPTGPFGVGLEVILLVDDARPEEFTADPADRREVAVQIWYPALPAAGAVPLPYQSRAVTRATAEYLGWPLFANSFMTLVPSHSFAAAPPEREATPFPVLLYNHGYSGFSGVHQSVCEDLASHGYVVASIGHAHESALFVLPDGGARGFDPEGEARQSRVAEATGSKQEAAKDRILRAASSHERTNTYRDLIRLSPLHQESTRLWTADSQFVLDELEKMNRAGGRFEGLLDLDHVGVFGHSLGGAVAGQLALTESRVQAGINIDGFQFGDLLTSRLTKPFLFMGAQRPWAGESMIANDIFYEASAAPAHIVLFRGFEHATFTDLPLFGFAPGAGENDTDGRRAIALQRTYVRAFFDHYLKGKPSHPIDHESADYPDAIVRARR